MRTKPLYSLQYTTLLFKMLCKNGTSISVLPFEQSGKFFHPALRLCELSAFAVGKLLYPLVPSFSFRFPGNAAVISRSKVRDTNLLLSSRARFLVFHWRSPFVSAQGQRPFFAVLLENFQFLPILLANFNSFFPRPP